jgi:hypothetical protein
MIINETPDTDNYSVPARSFNFRQEKKENLNHLNFFEPIGDIFSLVVLGMIHLLGFQRIELETAGSGYDWGLLFPERL